MVFSLLTFWPELFGLFDDFPNAILLDRLGCEFISMHRGELWETTLMPHDVCNCCAWFPKFWPVLVNLIFILEKSFVMQQGKKNGSNRLA
jgi:hypothetical protein